MTMLAFSDREAVAFMKNTVSDRSVIAIASDHVIYCCHVPKKCKVFPGSNLVVTSCAGKTRLISCQNYLSKLFVKIATLLFILHVF